MPENDLSGFESRLRVALLEEAAHVDVADDLPRRVRARARRRHYGRRSAAGAFVAALVVVAALATTLPRSQPSVAPPRPTAGPWQHVGTIRPQPGSPVSQIDAAGGVLYGTAVHDHATYVVRSGDAGVTWTVPGPSPCGHGGILGLDFADAEHGVASCDGSFEVTADGATTWTSLPNLGQPGETPQQATDPMFPVAAGYGSLWVLTYHCTSTGSRTEACQQGMETSTDGGTSWSATSLELESSGVETGYAPGTNASIQVTGPHSGYVLSFGNGTPLTLFATSNAFRTWRSSAVPCDDSASWAGTDELLAATPSVLYLWCETLTTGAPDLALYRTTNGGRSWQLRASSFPAAFTTGNVQQPVVFVSAGPSTVFLQVGGMLLRSDDGGTTWNPVTAGGASLQASWLQFSDAQHGVLLDEAAGAGFGWWTTSDGGATWQRAIG
jgi:hypothetical protein